MLSGCVIGWCCLLCPILAILVLVAVEARVGYVALNCRRKADIVPC